MNTDVDISQLAIDRGGTAGEMYNAFAVSLTTDAQLAGLSVEIGEVQGHHLRAAETARVEQRQDRRVARLQYEPVR